MYREQARPAGTKAKEPMAKPDPKDNKYSKLTPGREGHATFSRVSLFVNSYGDLICKVVWKIEGESLEENRPLQKHLKAIPVDTVTFHSILPENKANLFESNHKAISLCRES
ncbi:hypothetical protein HDU96_002021 [Phlyctochytrium bullatum]|nr:hypothetical protein HDU96_002021 [Phlyctochytrium bullatum]